LAHQIGMMYERLGTSQSTDASAKQAVALQATAPSATAQDVAPTAVSSSRVVASARVPVTPLPAATARKLVPVIGVDTVLSLDPEPSCGTVASARERATGSARTSAVESGRDRVTEAVQPIPARTVLRRTPLDHAGEDPAVAIELVVADVLID
jgi:hypothetical protein